MDATLDLVPDRKRSPGTLGEVLYADPSKPVSYQKPSGSLSSRSVAAGDQAALHALYDRAHRVVFTLDLRMTANRETAEK